MPKKPRLMTGKPVAEAIQKEIAARVASLAKKKITPALHVVRVGNDPASEVYVRNKRKTSIELGMHGVEHHLPANCTERRLLNLVKKLNEDTAVHGILVQLPLPKQIDEAKITHAIDPRKDVDGFHPVNVGKMLIGEPDYLPCTPHGVQRMLMHYGYNPAGKHVVIVGRSNIVGKPLAAILMQKAEGANATVTVCHSRSKRLTTITQSADILVAAMGVPEFITAKHLRDGAVVVDVGVNRIPDKTKKSGARLVGDVNFESASRKAKAITPVPGGVGPMTITMLLLNTVRAAERYA